MNKTFQSTKYSLLAAFIFPLVFTVSTFATDHSYQVTGPVLALTGTSITVQKGQSPWTIARDANTNTAGDIKVGDKVAIKYHMMADTIAIKSLPKK
jgi:hypothetical protein